MGNKHTIEILNKELDRAGVPSQQSERTKIIAKLVKINKFKVDNLLHGRIKDPELIHRIADEFEIDLKHLYPETILRD